MGLLVRLLARVVFAKLCYRADQAESATAVDSERSDLTAGYTDTSSTRLRQTHGLLSPLSNASADAP
jgi:hypothetical protein